MISRRNIRVKVMQTLYSTSLQRDKLPQVQPTKILDTHFVQSRSLLVYLTWFLTEVARYAETDARQKAAKHLPTAYDLNVNTKLAGNSLLMRLLEDPALMAQFDIDKPALKADKELIRKIYLQLTETPAYQKYILAPERNKQDEKAILEFIFDTMMLDSEHFISHIEEAFTNWDDDGDMVIQLFAAYLQKPSSIDFRKMLSADKAVFANQLLDAVIEKAQHLESLIIPKLKNWDPDRIAYLDMLLMKMGVAEFLYFETIPPKVTINEYIDLAKEYSTQQSGQFINGILDNIHKDLATQNKLNKVAYKKA